ncbi:ABC transporter substrate-binding protein [Rhodovastum atsumiense]|uniref:ABC transporter substrate-binding protein n=1 Tax=Rhodovastum atsumiense TaxID=504468 RepID=A0A5M6IYY5_9PROT|nr:ABC transporter substrate-binding protein [Rhodovastum atsumiense]KAA5612595.1 ABC transporter substrate-binding protein [Rhodovastum atsumiense]CAH2601307.1 ABC transporter substrate-binding protein [Rhodovastum atsumiense]
MTVTRRSALGAAAASFLLPGQIRRAAAQTPVIRLGVLNDQSGNYRDDTGPLSVTCVRQAVEEFARQRPDIKVEVLSADHLNRPDTGAGIARRWFDEADVDAIIDVPTSSVALAVNTICRDKNKVFLNSGAATTDLTGGQCSPNTIQWTYDTYMLSKSTGGAMVRSGGDTWFFITANYVFGQQLQRDTARFVQEAGGKVLGAQTYPFPETTDFSALLLQAQASGAKVLGLCNSGTDTVNCIKQAHEFGLTGSMRIAAMLMYDSNVRAVGLAESQGLVMTESFYWDLNDRTRAFWERVRPKTPTQPPNMIQAGCYAATLHYLKTVAALGVAAAKADGRGAVAHMKAMPTDDDCFGAGQIREDGRKIHPSYLLQVKKPAESKSPIDVLKVVATTPADAAFRPMSEGGCSLVKS